MKPIHITFDSKEAEEKLLADKEFVSAMTKLINFASNISSRVEAEVGIANGRQIPGTITFETKDIIELLSFVDMSLQPDFPVNKARGLLGKLKKICLKYGINWTGRQF